MSYTTKEVSNATVKDATSEAQSECNGLLCCPECGGELMYYHSSHRFGDSITRIVCRQKCQGWKVLSEIDRNKRKR
jgi:hypothetical protein